MERLALREGFIHRHITQTGEPAVPTCQRSQITNGFKCRLHGSGLWGCQLLSIESLGACAGKANTSAHSAHLHGLFAASATQLHKLPFPTFIPFFRSPAARSISVLFPFAVYIPQILANSCQVHCRCHLAKLCRTRSFHPK